MPRRRVESIEALAAETRTWASEQNAAGIGTDWPFTTADPRTKLKRLYPTDET